MEGEVSSFEKFAHVDNKIGLWERELFRLCQERVTLIGRSVGRWLGATKDT